MAVPIYSLGTCRLNSTAEEGCENWLTTAETIVAANAACHHPAMTKPKMIKIDTALNASPAITVRFGFQRSAIAPPSSEKIKMGKYSNTVNNETAVGLLFVSSIM
ncbi:hypothetical protein D3C77_455620 [compost metagenome]